MRFGFRYHPVQEEAAHMHPWAGDLDDDYFAAGLVGPLGSRTRLRSIKLIGIKRLLHSSYGTLLAKGRGYELLVLEGIFPRKAYFLRYVCPSTGKHYVSGVPPRIGERRSISDALRWKFKLHPKATEPFFTKES